MRIVVTGGAGFIGSHVVEGYLAAGHTVAVVDNLSTGRRDQVPPTVPFWALDIRDPSLETVFATFRPDVVNHHAAQKSVPASVADPRLDADVNIAGFLQVLELCRQYAVSRVIFASSGGALASPTVIPSSEDAEPALTSAYAVSKWTGEHYLAWYQYACGLHPVILRYANVYGPRQTPDGESGVIPIFLEAISQQRPATIYCPDGMPHGATRDYVFVADVVAANVQALTTPASGVFHIGTGIETPTAAIWDQLRDISGWDPGVVWAGPRPGDLPRSALKADRARRELPWTATTSLAEGLQRTWDWHQATQRH